MNPITPQATQTRTRRQSSEFELLFQSLFQQGRGLCFPCDEGGKVQLDGLSERARANYFYALTVIGREFSVPAVRTLAPAG